MYGGKFYNTAVVASKIKMDTKICDISLFNSIQIGIMVIDPTTNTVIKINPAACIILSVDEEKIIDRGCYSKYLPFSYYNKYLNIKEQLQNKNCISNKEFVLNINNYKTVVLFNMSIFMHNEKEYFVNTLFDITKYKSLHDNYDKSWVAAKEILSNNVDYLRNGV